MLEARIRLNGVPLLRSCQDYLELPDYKHFVPTGLTGFRMSGLGDRIAAWQERSTSWQPPSAILKT